MEVLNHSKNNSFKNIKLKTVYVEIERLNWSNVMKKRFWKKHRLIRPCVSRICRQLLNIELQKRKKYSKDLVIKKEKGSPVKKNQNRTPVKKKNDVEDTKDSPACKKVGFSWKDCLAEEPPKKKLKLSNVEYFEPHSKSESLKEKPPDAENKNLESDDRPQMIENPQVIRNGGEIPQTKSNSEKPPGTNLLTLYTKNGVKVLSMKSVTVPKSKVSNISFLQKGIRRESSHVKSTSLEPLSNSCDINKKDGIENPCSDELENKLEDLIKTEKPVEILEEETLDEEIDDDDNNKDENVKIKTERLEQSQLNDLKTRGSEIDSGKQSVSKLDKNESSEESEVDRTESDNESVIDKKNERDMEFVKEENGNETDVESVNEADRNETDVKSDIEGDKDDDKESISGDNRSDDDDSQSNATSDTESLPEVDPSFDPLKFLDCAIKIDSDKDPENQNKNEEVPFMKSQNFQLNCDPRVMIKPLLPESITREFSFKNQIKLKCSYHIRCDLLKMVFHGQYGVKNHYIHQNNQKDEEDLPPPPFVDPFTHSVFAPIIKRDRLKDKKDKINSLRKFRPLVSKQNNQALGLQQYSHMNNPSTGAYNHEKTFCKPFNSTENPNSAYQPLNVNLPPNAVPINSNTIKIGNNFFSRVYAGNAPTQMFRPMNASENIVHAPQPRVSKITMCTPKVISSSNNSPANISRYIYTASSSTGMPLLVPVVQSNSPNNNTIPVLTSIPNSQYSNALPTGNGVPPNGPTSEISKPPYMNFGDSATPRQMSYVPLNTFNQTRPVLINNANSSTYPPILNGNSTNPQCNIVNNFSVPSLVNHGSPVVATDISSLSQQHNQMTSMSLSNNVSNVGNNCNDTFIRHSVIVNHHMNSPLHLSSHSSSNATVQTGEIQMNQCESPPFFQWLHELKNVGRRCGSGCSFGSKTFYYNYVKHAQMFISNGFPNSFLSVMNAVYQLLIADMDYCSFHAQIIMNSPDYLEDIRTMCNLENERSFAKFYGLQLPYISPLISNPSITSAYNFFIFKRFVFVVDKKTRTVLCPLPATCKFQENDVYDKITVLVLMSPRFGLGPGLVIFPRSILGGNILLSLGHSGPLFETWTISAHQKGGLTQSMMTDFLNGPCRTWILRRKINQDTCLAIDWWWSLEDQLIDNMYNTCNYFSLHKLFPIGKDPFDLSISFYMERLWGLLVKARNDVDKQKLQEHNFPQFIYTVFSKLCDSNRLSLWCRESGLYPYNQNIKDGFLSRVFNMCE